MCGMCGNIGAPGVCAIVSAGILALLALMQQKWLVADVRFVHLDLREVASSVFRGASSSCQQAGPGSAGDERGGSG